MEKQRAREIYLHELDGAVGSAMDSISEKFVQKIPKLQPKPLSKNKKCSHKK